MSNEQTPVQIEQAFVPFGRLRAKTLRDGKLLAQRIADSSFVTRLGYAEPVGNPDDYKKVDFTMSDISSTNKFTEDAEYCLTVAHFGTSRDGTTLSFLLHLAPDAFKRKSRFLKVYPQLLAQFATQTVADSRSSVITGGISSVQPIDHPLSFLHRLGYPRTTHKLAAIHQQILGTETSALKPKILPPLKRTFTNTYVDTQARTLYVAQTTSRIKADGIFRPAVTRSLRTRYTR